MSVRESTQFIAKLNGMMVLIPFLVVIPLILAVGCDRADSGEKLQSPPIEISVEEAQAVLNQAVTYAQEHDLDALCGMGGAVSICEHQWRDAGEWDGVPSEPPEIVDTYYLPTKHFDNGFHATGGRVLVLEGINGKGEPYRTEFMVFKTDDPSAGSGGLAVINVVYWSGFGIAQPNDDGTVTTGGTPEGQ